jgi:broad specificity phosphatase PhoE
LEIQSSRPGWRLFRDGCPGGESPTDVRARADRFIECVRAIPGDVLVFSSGHILRAITARWLELDVTVGERFYLATGSLSALGYDRSLAQPVVRLWNDLTHASG